MSGGIRELRGRSDLLCYLSDEAPGAEATWGEKTAPTAQVAPTTGATAVAETAE